MNENVKAFVQDLLDNPPADLAVAPDRDPELRVRYLREFDLDDPLYPNLVQDAEQVLPRVDPQGQPRADHHLHRVRGIPGPWQQASSKWRRHQPHCGALHHQGLPPLWTLLVRADTGMPPDFWREHTDKEKADRQNECFAYYGAVREPEGGVVDLCPNCFTERTPSGTCMC